MIYLREWGAIVECSLSETEGNISMRTDRYDGQSVTIRLSSQQL